MPSLQLRNARSVLSDYAVGRRDRPPTVLCGPRRPVSVPWEAGRCRVRANSHRRRLLVAATGCTWCVRGSRFSAPLPPDEAGHCGGWRGRIHIPPSIPRVLGSTGPVSNRDRTSCAAVVLEVEQTPPAEARGADGVCIATQGRVATSGLHHNRETVGRALQPTEPRSA